MPSIARALAGLKVRSAVIDGEAIVIASGASSLVVPTQLSRRFAMSGRRPLTWEFLPRRIVSRRQARHLELW
jgi:hypothetical protein